MDGQPRHLGIDFRGAGGAVPIVRVVDRIQGLVMRDEEQERQAAGPRSRARSRAPAFGMSRTMHIIRGCVGTLVFSASAWVLYFGMVYGWGLVLVLGLFGLGCAVNDGRRFVRRLRVDGTLRLGHERRHKRYGEAGS